jgi:hypothetical protein
MSRESTLPSDWSGEVEGRGRYVKGMKAAAEGIESAVGLKGIDYLVGKLSLQLRTES